MQFGLPYGIVCIPSQYEEGFCRVALEAVSCGIPVVASNKGGLKEALDDSVAILVDPTVQNLKEAILTLYKNTEHYWRLKNNCRTFALRRYSEQNAETILKNYATYSS